jgi:hypothetical protein
MLPTGTRNWDPQDVVSIVSVTPNHFHKSRYKRRAPRRYLPIQLLLKRTPCEFVMWVEIKSS